MYKVYVFMHARVYFSVFSLFLVLKNHVFFALRLIFSYFSTRGLKSRSVFVASVL